MYQSLGAPVLYRRAGRRWYVTHSMIFKSFCPWVLVGSSHDPYSLTIPTPWHIHLFFEFFK